MVRILQRRPAIDTASPFLQSHISSDRVYSEQAGVILQPRPKLSILQIAAFKGRGPEVRRVIEATMDTAPSDTPNGSVWGDGFRILWVGPEAYWLVTEDGETESLASRLAVSLFDTLAQKAALTDQGHGRTCIRISGAHARAVLAKGSTLDFHRSAFAPGACAQTAFLGVSVLIDCAPSAAPDYSGGDAGFGYGVFDLYTARSSAQHVFESLAEASLEFGVKIEAET